jgi:hypothetical protein
VPVTNFRPDLGQAGVNAGTVGILRAPKALVRCVEQEVATEAGEAAFDACSGVADGAVHHIHVHKYVLAVVAQQTVVTAQANPVSSCSAQIASEVGKGVPWNQDIVHTS